MLITARDQEQSRYNQTEVLHFGSLVRTAVAQGSARLRLETPGARAHDGQPDEICIDVDPLYLFGCALLWHKSGDAGAGWELVQGLKSVEPGALVAKTLLAETENLQLRLRDLRGASSGPVMPLPETGSPVREIGEVAATMNTPYGLEIIENCVAN